MTDMKRGKDSRPIRTMIIKKYGCSKYEYQKRKSLRIKGRKNEIYINIA